MLDFEDYDELDCDNFILCRGCRGRYCWAYMFLYKYARSSRNYYLEKK